MRVTLDDQMCRDLDSLMRKLASIIEDAEIHTLYGEGGGPNATEHEYAAIPIDRWDEMVAAFNKWDDGE